MLNFLVVRPVVFFFKSNYFLSEAIEAPVTDDDPAAVVYLKDQNKACNDLGIDF